MERQKHRPFILCALLILCIGSLASVYPAHANLEYLSSLGLNVKEYPADNYSHILGVTLRPGEVHSPSKLQQICKLRIADIEKSKGGKSGTDADGTGVKGVEDDRVCGISVEEYMARIKDFDEMHGKPLNLGERIAENALNMAIAAEFKKSSPSKGDINADLDPVKQCLEYAKAGVSVISVLTETAHFKGTLEDMKAVRIATQAWSISNNFPRPAILRKDFILDKYQILEARANGADSVLLIVAVLGKQQLQELIEYCRQLEIEPLVEVHTQEEVDIALSCGAKCMGINNRNLHTFQLDLQTTHDAVAVIEKSGRTWKPLSHNSRDERRTPDITVAALSGITTRDDIIRFKDIGVSCCLVGETLMKSNDPVRTIRDLLGMITTAEQQILIKVCGMTNVEEVTAALSGGVDLIGLIFADSPRKVSFKRAGEIVRVVKGYGERQHRIGFKKEMAALLYEDQCTAKHWFARMAASIR